MTSSREKWSHVDETSVGRHGLGLMVFEIAGDVDVGAGGKGALGHVRP